MKKIASIIILMMLSIVFSQAQNATIDGSIACATAPGCPKYICANDTMTIVAGITSGSIDSVKWRERISIDGGTSWSTWTIVGANSSQRVPSSGLATTTTRYQYWVRVYQGTEQYWAFADVFVDASPTVILVSNDTSVCFGTSVAFSASGGTNYHYKVNGISKQNGTTSTFTSTTLANHDTVTVRVTNANGCSTTSSPIIMTIYPKPTIASALGNPTPGCVGQMVNVTVSGVTGTPPYSFQFFDDAMGTSLYYTVPTTLSGPNGTFSAPIPGTAYTVKHLVVTDANGCNNK